MSVEQTLQTLAEQAEAMQNANIELTEADLELLSKEEIGALIENLDQLDEVSKATLAQYVAKAGEAGADADGGTGTGKVRSKLESGEKSSMLKPPAVKEAGKDTVITDASSKEAGDKTKARNEEIDLGGLLSGEELSEEFKAKAATVFEAAVEAKVTARVAVIKEELEAESAKSVSSLNEGLIEKVDGYLGYIAEKWMEKNELALDRGIRSEIFESMMVGLKGLFESHNINLPDEKFDVVEEAQSRIAELEESVTALTEDNIALSGVLKTIAKDAQIEEASEGLSELDAAKFTTLAEAIVFENEESFATKLTQIRENYFSKPTKAKEVVTESFITDVPVIVEEAQKPAVTLDPKMNKYVNALKY